MSNNNVGTATPITSSTLIKSSQGTMFGFYVSSTSTGVIQIYDSATASTTAGTALSGAITPAIGWNVFPACFANGLYINVNSGSINLSPVWV